MKAQDILLEDNDLLIRDGDLVVGDSDQDHIEDIIRAYPGWYKEFPQVGVGIDSFLNSSGTLQELERSIKIQLQADGYSVDNPIVDVQSDNVTINPNAVRN